MSLRTSSKHNPNDITKSNTHISTFSQSPFNIDDEIPSSCLELLDWDQCGPPIFDQFENDDALEIEIYEGIKIGDHKETISPKVNTLAYFGEPTTPSSCKEKREKMKKVGLLVKTKRHY